MSDPTDTAPTTKRMTTAEVAALAQGVDNRLDDLSVVVTDLATRLQDLGGGNASSQDSITPEQVHEAIGHATAALDMKMVTSDQVDGRIHEVLAPLHDEVHELRKSLQNPATKSNLDAILARLEDAERKVAALDVGAITQQVAADLHPTMSRLRQRVTELEAEAEKVAGDPVSHTLAEDALADQIQATVERLLSEHAPADEPSQVRATQLARDIQDLRHRLPDTAAGVRAALSPTPVLGGLGAARKVLQLMRQVTHISKDRQAELGERGGRFKFRGVDEAMDAVGHAMREVGLILSPEVLKDETTQNMVTKSGTGQNGRPYESSVLWTTTKLTMRYTFLDPEDGSTHPLEMVGEGRDASDKSTSKAASMAFKYGLLQALCIPVNGLDDSDAAPPQEVEQQRQPAPPRNPQPPAASSPQGQAERPAQDKSARAAEALAAIRNVYRVEGGPKAQYNRLVQIMNRVKQEDLLEATVEGSTLNQHGEAAMRTLQAPPPPEPPDQDGSNYGESGGY